MVSFLKRYQFHQIGTPPPSGQARHHRLPLVLPYPTLLSEASQPSLRVTLTHFTLSYLNLSGRSGRNRFFSPAVLSGYNGFLDTCFSGGRTRLMSWPDGEPYSCPLQLAVVSLLFSLISTPLLFRTGGVLSH